MTHIWFGAYRCTRCSKTYTVNEPGTWRLCSPLLCHDCYDPLHKRLPDAPQGIPIPDNTISDGFGSFWIPCRSDCGLHVVRPGKVQCDNQTCPYSPSATHKPDTQETPHVGTDAAAHAEPAIINLRDAQITDYAALTVTAHSTEVLRVSPEGKLLVPKDGGYVDLGVTVPMPLPTESTAACIAVIAALAKAMIEARGSRADDSRRS